MAETTNTTSGSTMQLAKGILLMLLGLAALSMPTLTTYAVNLTLGWSLLLGGVFIGLGLVFGKSEDGVFRNLILTILLILIGVLILTNPIHGMLTLSAIIMIYLLAQGVFSILMWIQARKIEGAGWLGINGLISLLLGCLILTNWPMSGVVFIGIVVGVHLVFWGCAEMMFAVTSRKS